MSAEVDRKRAELHDFNELSRCERDEKNHKDESSKVFRKELDDKFKLELIDKVNRRREFEITKKITENSLMRKIAAEVEISRLVNEVETFARKSKRTGKN